MNITIHGQGNIYTNWYIHGGVRFWTAVLTSRAWGCADESTVRSPSAVSIMLERLLPRLTPFTAGLELTSTREFLSCGTEDVTSGGTLLLSTSGHNSVEWLERHKGCKLHEALESQIRSDCGFKVFLLHTRLKFLPGAGPRYMCDHLRIF